jgi:hypothetical protein
MIAAEALSQDWTNNGPGRMVRADRRARVTEDTYQPVWTAETADGSRRRFYRFADAITWADRWPALGPTLDDLPSVRAAAVDLPCRS